MPSDRNTNLYFFCIIISYCSPTNKKGKNAICYLPEKYFAEKKYLPYFSLYISYPINGIYIGIIREVLRKNRKVLWMYLLVDGVVFYSCTFESFLSLYAGAALSTVDVTTLVA